MNALAGETFTIQVVPSILDDLRRRLAATRWPDEIDDDGAGLPVAFTRELTRYWADGFDWPSQQRELNELRHFRIEIDGLEIHCVRGGGHGKQRIPLLLLHGWPGSFLEMLKVLPLLEADFDVIVPSLPGYGFSNRPSQRGTSNLRIADLFAHLMTALGFDRFAAQGGDWGAGIATWLARRHPQRLIGIHLNYIPGSFDPDDEGTRTAEEETWLRERDRWSEEEGAYGHLQRTKPLTAAYGLNDSPAALCAWIVEKFRDWSDCGGDVYTRFTRDELLTNVTLYWITQTIHSSMRLYRESVSAPHRFARGERLRVPTGVARFAAEAPFPPRRRVERVFEVRRWTELPRGGHFAAMEEPELLAAEIRGFFGGL